MAENMTTPTVAEHVGLTYRVLDYWIREGAVTPEVVADGSGSRREWTPEQVARLRLVVALRDDLARLDLHPPTDLIARVWQALTRSGAYVYRTNTITIQIGEPQ